MPMFIEVFRALASRQRMFGEMQLAERVGFEPTVRFRDMLAFSMACLQVSAYNDVPLA
jgi:hypothetical protein